jgi:hypothetical protein
VPLPESLDRLAALAAPLHADDLDALCGRLLDGVSEGDTLRDDAVVLCVRFTDRPG